MKRAAVWIVGAGIAGVALMLAIRAQEQQAQAPASEASATERVAFTFSDEAQMQQFAQLWQQRQAMVTRMAVLQSYWNQEQTSLGQLNGQLLSQYNLDVTKNYTLDGQRKVLLEREAPPEQPGQAQTLAQPTPATPSSP